MHIALDIKVLHKDGTLVLTDRDGKALTFSKEQTIQQKVSMITLGELCDLPKHQLANSFGFKTRKSYYDNYDTRLLCFGWWLMGFGLAWRSTRHTSPITASRQHAPRAVVV